MTVFRLAATLVGGLVAGAFVIGFAAPASADNADVQFLHSLSHLGDTGFDMSEYEPGRLISVGHMVCDMFDQGEDSPTVSGAVVGALSMWSNSHPEYNATLIVKGATAAYCPAYNSKTGQI